MAVTIEVPRDPADIKPYSRLRADGTTEEGVESSTIAITIETREDLEQEPVRLTDVWVRETLGEVYVQHPHLLTDEQRALVRTKYAECRVECDPQWSALRARLVGLSEPGWQQYLEKAGAEAIGETRREQVSNYLGRS